MLILKSVLLEGSFLFSERRAKEAMVHNDEEAKDSSEMEERKGHKIIFDDKAAIDSPKAADLRMKVAKLLLENGLYFCQEAVRVYNFFVHNFATGESAYLPDDLLEQIKKMEGVKTVIETNCRDRYAHKNLNTYQPDNQ